MQWIAPDRAGYGLSEPLAEGSADPQTLARWTLAFIEALGLPSLVIVAHSISAGAAVWFAAQAPERLTKLVLLAPFCRPTPHRWMLGLRIAVAPVVGRPVRRYLLPVMLPLFRQSILEGMLHPNPVPRWLKRFPVEYAAQSQSIKTMAAELRSFNAGMSRNAAKLRVTVPTIAIFGSADETALPNWHSAWLRKHVAHLEIIRIAGAGHAIHHARPADALRAITAP